MLEQDSRKRSKQGVMPAVARGRFVCETDIDEHDPYAHAKPPVVKTPRPIAPIQCPGANRIPAYGAISRQRKE